MQEKELLISEVAKMAGVSVRTIRYYIGEGLLPPPQSRGRYSVYDEDYILRLRLIQNLKDAYLPLAEIRRQIATLSTEDVRKLLEEGTSEDYNHLPSPKMNQIRETTAFADAAEAKNSATDYISRVLAKRSNAPMNSVQRPPNAAPAHIQAMHESQVMPAPPPEPVKSKWRRIQISEDIEIHLREPIPARKLKQLELAIEQIKKTLL
ncbi:MAG: MerR family transcriptional regulator [Anaerolineaceae bacterium]|nr:MerR family transcriptional regulator [Anaerolineaceae bacterium]